VSSLKYCFVENSTLIFVQMRLRFHFFSNQLGKKMCLRVRAQLLALKTLHIVDLETSEMVRSWILWFKISQGDFLEKNGFVMFLLYSSCAAKIQLQQVFLSWMGVSILMEMWSTQHHWTTVLASRLSPRKRTLRKKGDDDGWYARTRKSSQLGKNKGNNLRLL